MEKVKAKSKFSVTDLQLLSSTLDVLVRRGVSEADAVQYIKAAWTTDERMVNMLAELYRQRIEQFITTAARMPSAPKKVRSIGKAVKIYLAEDFKLATRH